MLDTVFNFQGTRPIREHLPSVFPGPLRQSIFVVSAAFIGLGRSDPVCFVSPLLSVLIIPPIEHIAISEKCTVYAAYSNMYKKDEYTPYSKMNIGGIFPEK